MIRVRNIDQSFSSIARFDWSQVRQLSLLTKNSVLAAGLSYALTLHIASYLGPAGFGYYSYILIVGTFAGMLVSFATENTAPVVMAETKSTAEVLSAVWSVRILFFAVLLLSLPAMMFVDPAIALGTLAVVAGSFNFAFLYEVTARNVTYSYIYLVERLAYIAAVAGMIYFGVASVPLVFLVMFFSRF
ncbi:MAG: hypothetical protein KDD44_10415, partial [Bdellovibrionales bacterium]|nr:hypothetical protein [Bdellovibrionales bacterium]